MASLLRGPADDLEALLRALPDPAPRAAERDEPPRVMPPVGEVALPVAAAAPSDASDDPFSELELSLDAEDTLVAAPDHLGDIRSLFDTRPAPPHPSTRPQHASRTVGGSGWPGHNYNAAYQSLQSEQARHAPPRRRRAPIAEHELWEIDRLSSEGPAPTPAPQVHAPAIHPDAAGIQAALADAPIGRPSVVHAPAVVQAAPWPSQAAGTGADQWLAALGDGPEVHATLAQMVAGVPLRREPAPLFDLTDVLFARPRRRMHPVGSMKDVPAAANPPSMSARMLRVASLVAGTIFALALLQLLVLSL